MVLEREGRAVPVAPGAGRALGVVGVGQSLEGHALRIVDEHARPLPERTLGEIEFAGPSAIDGYWGEVGRASLRSTDGYVRTGDLGYLADGNLFVTGRWKEIIIYYGRNIVPSQIEAFVERGVNGVVTKGAAVIGIPSREQGTEEVHLLVETRVVPPERQVAVEQDLTSAVAEAFDVHLSGIHWLEKGAIPRTSSGKIQRYRCRQMVLAGRSERARLSAADLERSAGDRADRPAAF
jgi:acyl-CoA synthetase (AMP-forming)/AMP-acid ligase II